ncbi:MULTISPECIES: GntR family transcriptional regulator [Microbispora]|uniref:Winged helix-turn-helix transcriptional regulator n=1 Tax=Microbispora hainanensis TaxID=568844 RepID=A0A544Y530_9ACTN|nr:winged helix-turn-helix domain-containing protein [Microbispora hainanensis]TQS11853.1 winged helix-turn-helix transcriptional regulator [Microbispora hainanensis]
MIEKTGRPAYMQIADELRGQIRNGSLPPGTVLPSINQLCERYGVSSSVVKAAISVLRTEGLIVGQQGKGVFVREQESAGPAETAGGSEIMEQLAEMRALMRDLGDRIADLESAVFPGQKRSGEPGK